MPRYLVLANQTAASPELAGAVREVLENNPDTEFVLLVPATPVEDLLEWQDAEGETVAKRTAQAAKEQLEQASAKVVSMEVGDASPVSAIENELQAIRINMTASLSPRLRCKGRAGWRLTSRAPFKLPVKHVVAHEERVSRCRGARHARP